MMKIEIEATVSKYVMYDGLKFYKDKKGYWISESNRKTPPKRLHVYVWEKHNGKVPKGFHIHHKDHDQDNNDIENLELMEVWKHLSYHGKLNGIDARENLLKNAQPKAIEWHKSDKGREWHKKHYQAMKEKLNKKIIITCLVCGKELEVGQGGAGNKFCSNNCKSQYRRDKGLDNIMKECEFCHGHFLTNKYLPRKYCTKECQVMGKRENNKNRTS